MSFKSFSDEIVTINGDECIVDRYDILSALMESQDPDMQMSLSKLIHDMTLTERQTKQYINAVNVKVSGNEKLLEYIQRMA